MAKSIWQEIKEQPSHIRETFMWLCVVVTFSIVGYAWFSSTAKQFVALVNPEQAQRAQTLAQVPSSEPLPFATITSSLKGLGASIWELVDITKRTKDIEIKNNSNSGIVGENNLPIPAQKLPISGNKAKKWIGQ